MIKPKLVFFAGWWRVSHHPETYKRRSKQDRLNWTLAYEHVDKLNRSEFYTVMRNGFYEKQEKEYREKQSHNVVTLDDAVRMMQ